MTKYFELSIIEMKILFHILLDMNQKTKISTKFPRSKLGVATVVLSLGGVAVYSLGVINPLQASQSEYLQVDGVQNSVQYLTSLVIDSPTAKVEFKYDDASKAVRASGSLNMQNLVVGQGNESSASSVVFWWTENNNQWANSVIVWGNNTTNEGNNNVIILSPGSKSSSENTAILNGQNVVTNGKNITVVNGGNLDVREKSKVSGNYVTVFGDSLVAADHVVVFGDKVKNNKSNTFVFNGQDTEFVPEQESAFYANSKVAINGDYANATLDVHGGMMIGKRGDYSVPRDWDSSGIISLFSRENKTGLCGYDGKAKRRVPLSESARKSWLCAPMWDIWNLPANAVSNNPQRSFPQVWNQNKDRHWDWESPKWIYGSKKEPQHFLCADGYVPDVADPIGKTGVKCIPCEWAKSGDLSCTTQKGDNSAATPHCPQGTNYNETSKKCEGTKSTPCVAWDNIVRFNPDTQIETYNADTWIWDITQKCEAVECQEGYTLEGKRCVPAKCQGQLPENAIGFTGAWNVQWHYNATMEKACSFKCDDSSSDQKNKYFRIKDKSSLGGSCKRCADGQYNDKIKKCVKGIKCPDGYQDDGSGKCKALMECLTDGQSVREWNARYLENYRPFGTNLNWTYTWGNLQPNSCQFTCAPDEVPHRSYKLPHCIKRWCSSSSYASGAIENLNGMPETGFNNDGLVFSRPAYWAKTLDEFREKYKDKPGCRERCPGLDEYKDKISEWWACTSVYTLKNWSSTNNSNSDKKYCLLESSLLGDGWDKYEWSPSQSMYRIKKWNSSRWSSDSACTAYCSGDKITGEKLGMKDKTREYCLKKTCGKDEWLNEDWICKKCHPGNIPDSNSVKISWYPTKCKYPCKEGEAYVSGKCVKASVDKQCPEGSELKDGQCISDPS